MNTSVTEPEQSTIVPASELQEGDRIPYDTILGVVRLMEQATVKRVDSAAGGKVAVTLYRIGTVFIPAQWPVRVLQD